MLTNDDNLQMAIYKKAFQEKTNKNIENNIGIFPADFATLNYAFVCSDYNIVTELPLVNDTDA